MSLFVVSTKDGWVDIMRRGVDARGIDLEVLIVSICLNHNEIFFTIKVKSLFIFIYQSRKELTQLTRQGSHERTLIDLSIPSH